MSPDATAPVGAASRDPAPPIKRTTVIRRWMALLMLAILLASVAVWYFSRDTLPSRIRIATSPEGGLYHRVGTLLKPVLEKKLGRPVELIPTRGSVDNQWMLLQGEADLAILQDGAIDSHGMVVVAPLYHDVIHVLVRREGGLRAIDDFEGHNIALGPVGSGMRQTALLLLGHYGMTAEQLGQNDRYFGDLSDDPTLEGAIITTGFLNEDLHRVMDTRQFDLLPIRDAESLSIHHPYLFPKLIPTGVFEGHPPVPETPISSLATTAYLGAREGTSNLLVRRALAALYEHDLRQSIPTLLPLSEARRTTLGNLHPAARNYFDPFGGVELLSNLLESLSAVKELLFALFAGMYLVWDRWRRIKEREERAAIGLLKERLDEFLLETVRLEQAQMETDDPGQLREHLDAVTRVKLRAIQELTHEDLRGDRMFSIFLAQCGDLAVKIQAKLNRSRQSDPGTLHS
ncbi:MAG: TAXI family TRAP transporter solute-binding subunit [Planctomycetales bacterium]